MELPIGIPPGIPINKFKLFQTANLCHVYCFRHEPKLLRPDQVDLNYRNCPYFKSRVIGQTTLLLDNQTVNSDDVRDI